MHSVQSLPLDKSFVMYKKNKWVYKFDEGFRIHYLLRLLNIYTVLFCFSSTHIRFNSSLSFVYLPLQYYIVLMHTIVCFKNWFEFSMLYYLAVMFAIMCPDLLTVTMQEYRRAAEIIFIVFLTILDSSWFVRFKMYVLCCTLGHPQRFAAECYLFVFTTCLLY